MAKLQQLADQEESALTSEEKRFLLDLEFLQSLANPSYIQCTFASIPASSHTSQ